MSFSTVFMSGWRTRLRNRDAPGTIRFNCSRDRGAATACSYRRSAALRRECQRGEELPMNNKAYLRLLTLPFAVTSLVLHADDNPDLRCFIDSASRSLRSRQFDRAINELIPALRVAKRERASNETVSA